MKIAILSDIHGNRLALDAVLADIEAHGGVDATWILGDLCALGPQPLLALEQIRAIPNQRIVRGNTDRYLLTGDLPFANLEERVGDLHKVQIYVEIVASLAWTAGAVTTTGWLPFLHQIPLEQRVDLLDGAQVLLVHASPGTDTGDGVTMETPEAEMRELFHGCTADLVFVGHTHVPVDRTVELENGHRVRVVNPASVSNPRVPSLNASYGILSADESGYLYERREVPWDRQAILDLMDAIRFPGAEHVAEFLRGDNVS
ncbi:MAG: metallophosphoesterase family protein [Caldilineaceae bacterium]|nr:metallophosphoesterase family protein [Caldilineaceae bacterium]